MPGAKRTRPRARSGKTMLHRMLRIPLIAAMLFLALVSALSGGKFGNVFEGESDITDY